ncbi:uncharacterized protein K444DRAFT_612496 [Hyaloscypha bicolor E]|uniref:Uncharacterized protein n=1 Tax=Hyaloscypha bicolor E TaxID=1095630 RepID=A0A2J6TB92_9HELO|nr:uncharacterized protein K444DRAFT_612496 [Hyaloscypha bicolor E]PMD60297.1 hypothetical protein K444DRAFT_612496 [Hyaloscypha bicolor E]
MAHKAKPKLKPSPTQSTKTTQKTKSIQKTKTTKETTTTENANKNNLTPSSFTEPVLRVVSPPSAGKGSKSPQKPQPDEDGTTKTPIVVFHKQEKEDNIADIIGVKTLTMWKKSSGRSKSWANCRRTKLSQGDLELLAQSQTRSVSFGWQFSSMVTPSLFARSHGIRVNSEPTQKRLSTARTSGYLAVDQNRYVPLPRGRPVFGWAKRQGSEHRAELGFLRLTINREDVNLTREAYLSEIDLSKSDAPGSKRPWRVAGIQCFPVLRFLRNESHADVYLIQNPNNPFKLYHAHAFLNDGLSGNWSTFAKRKMKHLRGSRDFLTETIQRGRVIIIMKAGPNAEEFHLNNTQKEFPPLPGIDPKSVKIRPNKNRISYAAVVGRNRSSKHCLDSNHRAYKAWENRNGRGKTKAIPKVVPSRAIEESQLDTKSEDFSAWVTVGRRRLQGIALRNRGSKLSKVIM